MPATASILAFSGSTRTGSVNKKLIRIAVAGAREAGAEVMLIDLRDFPLPLYDGDLEAAGGMPARAVELRQLVKAHRGLLIATAEYNNSVTGVLKNAIDWLSRPLGADQWGDCFAGRAAALVSGSRSSAAGLRSQMHLGQILNAVRVLVIPEHCGVPRASEASFDEQGDLLDPLLQDKVRGVGAALAKFLHAWSAGHGVT